MGSVDKAAKDVRAMATSVTDDVRPLEVRYDKLGSDANVSVREVGDAARKLAADVDRLTQRADAMLAGSEDDLRASAQSLRSAADAVGGTAGRMRDPRQVIYGPARDALGPGEGKR